MQQVPHFITFKKFRHWLKLSNFAEPKQNQILAEITLKFWPNRNLVCPLSFDTLNKPTKFGYLWSVGQK